MAQAVAAAPTAQTAAEALVTEAPAAEVPVTEAEAAEAPVTEAAEVPMTEVPVTEAEAAEALPPESPGRRLRLRSRAATAVRPTAARWAARQRQRVAQVRRQQAQA